MSDGEQLGERLKALRTARGWSQTQTAQAAQVAQTVVSRLERGEGKQTSAKVLQRLADAYGVRVEELTGTRYDTAATLPGAAPPRLRVVMDAEAQSDVAALEAALLRLTAGGAYEVADFDAARTVVRETFRHLDPSAVTEHAEALLRAAKGLRKEGKTASVTDVLARMAYGPSARSQANATAELDEINTRADDALRAKGYEPGQGAAGLQERLAAVAAKKRRRNEA